MLTAAKTKIYFSLTKPGILLGNLITATMGFALGSQGNIDILRLLSTLTGLLCIIACACICNNCIDKEADAKMSRTKQRALVCQLLTLKDALRFALLLGILGVFILGFFSTFLALGIALFGFFVYVVLYSFYKYRSMHATLIGSFAGAATPLVGYCAVSNRFDAAAVWIFLLLLLWQMPHFFAIAQYRIQDYAAASIPVLPLKKNAMQTKTYVLIYVIAFFIVAHFPVVSRWVHLEYFLISTPLCLAWIGISIYGFVCNEEKRWARTMFFFSLLVISGLCISIAIYSKIN